MKNRLFTALAAAALFATAACTTTDYAQDMPTRIIDPERQEYAIAEAMELKERGSRVWCVPFARNLSGIDIRGNAKTWWSQAKSQYAVGHDPVVGAVMAFKPTSGMPLGHVAVVSKIDGPRKILVDHANWHRDQISLGMAVIDISDANDWSRVRLESQPGAYGGAYPIFGFIAPPKEQNVQIASADISG